MEKVFYPGLMVEFIKVHFSLINDMVSAHLKIQISRNSRLAHFELKKKNIKHLFFLQGLYCQDERFGPGILIYKSMQVADVGFWVSEDLVRILYPNASLQFDIYITDKKTVNETTCIIPSWYSPKELLNTTIDLDYVIKRKSNTLFCKSVDENSDSLKYYLIDHSDRVEEAIQQKRALLDAYLMRLNNDDLHQEKILKEHIADISLPNETYELRQMYSYTNKFWPLKQRAAFPIDEILSSKEINI